MREHQNAVFAVAYARLRNKHDAEDVVQDVFLEACRSAAKMKNPEKVAFWLYKAANCRCKDHLKKLSRRERRESEFAQSLGRNPATPDEEEERIDALMAAINLLPEDFRVLVMLRHFAKLSYADISKMTGLSRTTIDGRLRLAKKRLRRKLTDMGIGVD